MLYPGSGTRTCAQVQSHFRAFRCNCFFFLQVSTIHHHTACSYHQFRIPHTFHLIYPSSFLGYEIPIQYVDLHSLVFKIVLGIPLPWNQTVLTPKSKKGRQSKMSVERVPPRSAYDFSPPLRTWSDTSCALRPYRFPTTPVELGSFLHRLVTDLAISIITFFLFITFLLFVFFLIAFSLIAFSFITSLHRLLLHRFLLHRLSHAVPIFPGLNEWSNTWQAASVILQAVGIGSGRKDATWINLERNRGVPN